MANQEVDNGRMRTADREVLLTGQERALPWEAETVFCTKGTSTQTCTSWAAVAHFQCDGPGPGRDTFSQIPTETSVTGPDLSSPQAVWRPHSEHSTSCPLQAVQAKRVAPGPPCKDRTRALGDSVVMHSSDLGKRYSTQGLPWWTTPSPASVRVDCLALRLPIHGTEPCGRVIVAWSLGHRCRCS